MNSNFSYKKEPSKLVKACAWIIAGVSVALWCYAFLGLWFWGMLITVMTIAPNSFTNLAFAQHFSALLILSCPISYLFSGALEQLLNAYFRERV